jgi:RNA polymerase sigma-70 factor (ECF subfamily)
MSDEEFIRLGNLYKDSVYRLSYTYLKNHSDCDDAVQTTLLKLYTCKKKFESDEHVRNWLFKVAVNECRKMLGSPWSKNLPIDEADGETESVGEVGHDLFSAVNSLETKYRTVIYLFYYENYSVKQIAALLKKNPSTVRTQLQRAREQLKDKLNGVDFDEI